LGYLKRRNCLEDIGIDLRIILKWNLSVVRMSTGFIWLRTAFGDEPV